MRDFHESLSLNHLIKSILLNCLQKGLSLNIIGYKQSNNPKEGAIPVDIGVARTMILNRKYQGKSHFLRRYLYECWLVVRAAFHAKLWKESDICLAYSFPSSFIYLWVAKTIFRKKTIFWIQDLWPDNAVESGIIRKGSVPYKLFFAMEKLAYRKSDVIIPISEDIQQRLLDYGVPETKLNVIHNWGYDDSVQTIPWNENRFAVQAGLSEDIFYAIYAGNVGAVQNVELVISAAELLMERTDIRFLIVGDGVSLSAVKKKAEGLSNITFFPMQPPELARHVYSAASVNIVPLRKGIIYTALPSKTPVLLSCGRPVVASLDLDSHYASLLQKYGIGPVTPPEDAQALANAITHIADTADATGIAENAKICFEDQFSQKTAFRKFNDIFRRLIIELSQ